MKMRVSAFAVLRTPLLPVETPQPFEALNDPAAAHALRLAAPGLVEALQDPKRAREAQLPLAKFVARLRARSTPFGIAAGYSVVGRAPQSSFELVARSEYRAFARGDVDDLRDPATLPESLAATAGIYKVGATLRVPLRENGAGKTVSLTDSPTLRETLLRPGVHPRATWVELLHREGWTTEEAEDFLASLVELGALVSGATPPLASSAAQTPAPSSSNVPVEMSVPLAEAPRAHRDIAQRSTTIFDLVKGGDLRIGDTLARRIEAFSELIPRFTDLRVDRVLEDFQRTFSERYELRFVPLCTLFDSGTGLDYPAMRRDEWQPTPLDAFRAQLISDGAQHVNVSPRDLPTSQWEWGGAPSIVVRVQGADSFEFLEALGSPGTQFYARATAFEKTLLAAARARMARIADDAVVMDIRAHLPGRSSAYLQYPPLAPAELTLAGAANHQETEQIPLYRVLVGLRENRFVLRDAETGRLLHPVISSAANPNRRDIPPLYRFLAALANATAPVGRTFRWGAFHNLERLPRVSVDGVTIARAQWRPNAVDRAKLLEANEQEFGRIFQAFRERCDLPRLIRTSLPNDDQTLLVDLDDPLAMGILRSEYTVDLAFQEASTGESMVRGPEGTFENELVVPFEPIPSKSRTFPVVSHEDRDFDIRAPGDGVLYLRMFGDRDELLQLTRKGIANKLEDLIAERVISSWFYLPYSAPDAEIRVRIFGEAETLLGSVLPTMSLLLDPPLKDGSLRTWRLDTYERETYRYGNPESMEISEQIFHYSSLRTCAVEVPPDAESLVFLLVAELCQFLPAIVEESSRWESCIEAAIEQFGTDTPLERIERQNAASRLDQKCRKDGRFEGYLASEGVLIREASLLANALENADLPRVIAVHLHVHVVRIATTWCYYPEVEEIAYRIVAKILRRRAHKSGNR